MRLPFERKHPGMTVEERFELEYLKNQVPKFMKQFPTEEEALAEARYVCDVLGDLQDRYDVLKELPYPEVRIAMGTWLSLDDANLSDKARKKLSSRGFETIEDIILCADRLKELGCAYKYLYKELNSVCEELGYTHRFEM